MRARAALGATIALALSIPVSGPALAGASPVAHVACTQAKVEGKSKCIARGQFCRHTSRAEKDYERYGFKCNKRDNRGNWHLT